MICKNCHTSYNYLTKLGGKLKKKKKTYTVYMIVCKYQHA